MIFWPFLWMDLVVLDFLCSDLIWIGRKVEIFKSRTENGRVWLAEKALIWIFRIYNNFPTRKTQNYPITRQFPDFPIQKRNFRHFPLEKCDFCQNPGKSWIFAQIGQNGIKRVSLGKSLKNSENRKIFRIFTKNRDFLIFW